jgi:cytochrome oxidase Cu insertion factor (SCO1/SenC/PrrC family)
MMDDPTPTEDHMMEGATPTAEAMMEEEAMAMPGFFSVALTDIASGTAFTLADFKGKVILLEPFAQWCPTCLAQQREVVRLHQLLGERNDFVSVGLDIDPNEDAAMLREYLSRHGFDWLYAVAPTEVAREIGDLYGSQYLNPPSAPMLVIDRHGEVHPLEAGRKSAESLLAVVEPLLDEAM